MTKQDPEELTAVCRVMEELIRMHDSVFTVSMALPPDVHVISKMALCMCAHLRVQSNVRSVV